jgi:hypothetical protein
LEVCTLKHEDSEKDLGVTTDKKLNFREHMDNKIKKANSIVGLIRRSFRFLDEKMFKKLYVALERPHLEYAQSAWSPQYEGDIQLLEGVQRRATKLVPSLKNLEYEARLRKLKLPTLRYRRLRGDMIECFKMMGGIYDPSVTQFLQKAEVYQEDKGQRITLDKKLYYKGCKSNLRNHCFGIRNQNAWNSLAESIKNAPSINSFKGRLDYFWQHEPILYDFTAKFNSGRNLQRREMPNTVRTED